MRKIEFSEDQIIAILKAVEAGQYNDLYYNLCHRYSANTRKHGLKRMPGLA